LSLEFQDGPGLPDVKRMRALRAGEIVRKPDE
jgi:hypothetical protein